MSWTKLPVVFIASCEITVTRYRDTIESLLSPSRSEGWVPCKRSMAFRGGVEGGTSEFGAERGNSIIRELCGRGTRRDLRNASVPLRCGETRRKTPKSPRGKWSVPWFDSRNKISRAEFRGTDSDAIAPRCFSRCESRWSANNRLVAEIGS